MKCNDREKLFLFVHQMLEPDEADRVRRHIADCVDCARAADEYRKLDAGLDDWSAAEPSPWFDTKLRAREAASEQKNSGFFGFGMMGMLVAGVATMALILFAVVVFSHRGVVENQQSVGIEQQQVAAAVPPQEGATTEAAPQPLPAEEQLKMDENLSVLEDYEVVANFDALSELPQANNN
jgi:Putative zinc-finger